MKEIKKTICPLDCPDTCGMLATVENGRVTALAGDPDHPYTKGFICRKMKRFPERVYSPKRVLHPQIRVGAKGEGRFKRISWDEAWEHLVSRLGDIISSDGPETIFPFCYAGNMGKVNRFAGFPLFNKIGTIDPRQTICSAAASGAWKMMCGEAGGCPPETIDDAELIIGWGINIRVTNIHLWRYISAARKKGAKLVIIDPYRNETARLADVYVQVAPGGDSGLALGVLKLLVEKDQIDHAFIDRETEGFEHLAAYLESLQWGRLEAESGVEKAVMEKLAALFHDHPKTFVRIGVGLTRNSRGGMAVRAITSLAAACGLFDGGAGRGVLLFSGSFSGDSAKLTFPELAEAKRPEINMIHLGRALSEPHAAVKAVLVYNANPASVAPDSTAVRRGLSRSDLFTVVHEQVVTPTARFADLLLPATTFLENRDIYTSYGHFYFGIADRVIEPYGESLSNFDFFQELARRLGYTEAPFSQSLEERIAGYTQTIDELPDDFSLGRYEDGTYVLSGCARGSGSLLKQKKSRFRFQNGDDPTQPPIACLTESIEFDNVDLVSRFPFKLITPPNADLLNSTFGDLFEGRPGSVLIHPEDAAELEIVDGAEVMMSNFRGAVVRQAKISDATRPGLVVAEGLYWMPVEAGSGGINDLISQQCSDIGGGALFHEARVRIDQQVK